MQNQLDENKFPENKFADDDFEDDDFDEEDFPENPFADDEFEDDDFDEDELSENQLNSEQLVFYNTPQLVNNASCDIPRPKKYVSSGSGFSQPEKKISFDTPQTSEEEASPDTPQPEKKVSSETAKPKKKKKKKSNAEKKKSLAEKKEKFISHQLALTNVIAISFTMCVATAFMLLGERPTESFEENRSLAKCPTFTIESYLDGSFTSQFAEYFNDAVPMRSTFRNMISGYRDAMGIDYDDGVEIHGTVTLSNNTSAETQPISEPEQLIAETVEVTEAETEPPTIPPNEYADAEGEIANSVLIVDDRGMELYGGTFEAGETYASYVNQYKQLLGDSVNVYSMVIPTAVSFYLPKKYESATVSEIENIEHINKYLTDVTPIDAYQALLPHRNEAIYSRTDHHWQPLGAYYGAKALAETLDAPFADLSEYEEKRRDDYVGTLYSFTNSMTLKNNPEPFIYYVPKCEYRTIYYNNDMTGQREGDLIYDIDNFSPVSYYLVFMYGDDCVTHVHTGVHNNRTLCIIKDSYANAMIPCLTSSFSNIWVVDMRYFQKNIISFLQQKGVTDLVFAMSTFSATGINYLHLNELLHQ